MDEAYQSAAATLRQLLHDHHYTPEQLADTTVHALYPKLSAGAAGTFRQQGRGAILIDLRDLADGQLNTSYIGQDMLQRLNAAAELFDEAERAVRSYNPIDEFVVIVWQSALITVYKLDQI